MTDITFKSICSFVSDLGELFSAEVHSIALYERLLGKTTLAHTDAVQKHITCFRKFCLDNKESIINKTESFTGILTFSPKVFIDMGHVFTLADSASKEAIWSHLLTLLALLDPTSGAKDVLKKSTLLKVDSEGAEGDFLNNIISKVEQRVTASSSDNPQEAISDIMSSGMIPELISSLNTGISSGKLDLGKMMESVQKMVANVSENMPSDGDNSNGMDNGMLSQMMGMMNMLIK